MVSARLLFIVLDQNQWVLFDGYLLLFIIQKFLFTALTLSCPVPGGIFTPTFAIGAVIGQLYVSMLIKILAFFGLTSIIQFRGVYSILGAAAMTASVTRTVSVAMIVLELNGHLSHAVPLMVCVICSYGISEWLKPCSFFEMLADLGGLDAKVAAKGKIIIKDILEMRPDYTEFDYLSLAESTQDDLINIVKKHGTKSSVGSMRYIPVVDNHSERNLMY
jgi:H+/Cl- antiporter ClcA